MWVFDFVVSTSNAEIHWLYRTTMALESYFSQFSIQDCFIRHYNVNPAGQFVLHSAVILLLERKKERKKQTIRKKKERKKLTNGKKERKKERKKEADNV